METDIKGATDAIINITGGVNLTLFEAEQAAEVVREASNNDINTIFGSVINENLNDEVIVTVIATGFDKAQKKNREDVLYNANEKTNFKRATREGAVVEDDDDSDGGEFELPSFLKNRNY